MKKNLIKTLLFSILLICMLTVGGGIAAADYRFEVPTAEIIFWVESDGKVSISYQYTFYNQGQPLDYIDIGTPNDDFSVSDVEATIDGKAVSQSKISHADYSETGLAHGVTVDNTASPIPAGSSADVYVFIPGIGSLLYESDEPVESVATTETDVADGETSGETLEYVGFQFEPNFFDSSFVNGMTDYTVRLVLPVGIAESEPFYYSPHGWTGNGTPESWFTENKNIVYEWHSTNADASSEYTFGAMFPKAVLSSLDEVNASESTTTSSQNIFNQIFETLLMSIGCWLPLLIVFFGIRSSAKKAKRAKSYLPPKIDTDGGGGGIKRGLTAVEASIILEKELDKVISMIMFSVTKKGAVQIVSEDPMKFEFASPLPDDLYEYEENFIEALKEDDKEKRLELMKQTVHRLILSVTKKMKGFDLKETKEYYQSICEKAWGQVEAANTPDLRGELLDKNFGWAMLEEKPEKKVETVFSGMPVYAPSWWWRMDPTYHSMGKWSQPVSAGSGGIPVSVGGSGKSGGSISTPTLPGADFARSITNSMRGVGEATVGSMALFTNSIRGVTNPAPAPSSSSGRHGGSGRGGGSCACACACASCACACAGGGR